MKTITGLGRRSAGFTIVELLIVIVVIAILAAITVVAFNGIRDRAVVTSLKSDLSAIARRMELAKVDNGDSYTASFPSGATVSEGNVLQLTAVADATKSYCINGYAPGNKIASVATGGTLRDYLCSGATVGTALGGTPPTSPRGVDLLSGGFSTWTTSGGISYDASTQELVCNNSTTGVATSPLIRTDGAASGVFRYEGMATVPSPTRATSGTYGSSSYFAANGTTAAYNTTPSPGPYNGNGNAPQLPAPLSSWHPVNWTMTLGPAIVYVRLSVRCDVNATGYTSDTRYRNPTYTLQ